jgi:hypothetical protein
MLLLTLLLSMSARAAPTSPIDAANAQLRTLLSPLARPNPQLLFLYDMAAHMVDTIYYTDSCTAFTDINNFFAQYEEMRNAAYNPSSFDLPDTIYPHGLKYGKDTIPIIMMDYNSTLTKFVYIFL